MTRSSFSKLAVIGVVGAGLSGCVGVNGTIRVIHEYKGTEPQKTAAEAPAAEKKMPQQAETKPSAVKAVPPAERKADSITLEAARDTRLTHHSQELNLNSGKSNRLRARGIERGSAELVVIDFDRSKLKRFVEKYEGQSFSGKLMLHVRQVQDGSAEVKVCALETASQWNEGSGVLDKAKPGEATALEAQAGRKKWVTPKGKEVKEFKDLVYRNGEIIATKNEHGVKISGSGPVAITLDGDFIRHYATSPNVKGMVLYHWDNDAKVDFFSRDQYDKAPELVVKTK